MKKLLIIFASGLLFSNCKRNHYYCVCSSPAYSKDYGTQFATRESDYKKDCDSHLVNSNTTCNLVAE
jgi:hypothetical protein